MGDTPIGSNILTISPVIPFTRAGSKSKQIFSGCLFSVQASRVTRSGISTTVEYNTSGLSIERENIFGLDWFPMCNRSYTFVIPCLIHKIIAHNTKHTFSPLVTTNAVLSPFLSSRAFVATVVPILIDST